MKALFLLVASHMMVVTVRATDFDLRRETFAFSNDTVLRYGVDEQGRLHINRRDKPTTFSHRCFVLARAVLQFHKFVRFAPEDPKLSREEYRSLLRHVFRIPVWAAPRDQRIVFPGYPDLHSFSVAYEGLLKETLGNWVPSYLRVGNWRMAWPFPRCGQAAAARWLVRSLEQHQARAVYLARFPKMNHVVVVYNMERKSNDDIRFIVYDPNYPGEPSWIDYEQDTRSFSFQKRWYFPGGRINLFRVFISPIH